LITHHQTINIQHKIDLKASAILIVFFLLNGYSVFYKKKAKSFLVFIET